MNSLNHIFSLLGDAFWRMNLNTKEFDFLSPELEDIYQVSLDDLINDKELMNSMIHPDDKLATEKKFNKKLVTYSVDCTYRIITKKGKVKWLSEKRIVNKVEDQNFIIAIITDVTEEKELEMANLRNLDCYISLFENHPLIVFIYDKETDKFLAVNKTALTTLGYDAGDFLHLNIFNIIPGEDHKTFKKIFRHLSLFYANKGILKYKQSSGEIILVDVIARGINFKDREAIIIVANDVTEKLETEAELRKIDQLMHSLVQSQTNYLVRLNEHGFCTFVNPQFLKTFKVEEKDVLGNHFLKRVVEDEAEICIEAFKKCVENPGTVVPLVHQRMASDGTLFWTEWEFVSVDDENSHELEIQGIGHDITEKKASQEALFIQNKKLQEIAFISAHELRGPASSIIGLLDVLRLTQKEDTEIIDYLEKSANELDLYIRKIVKKTEQIKTANPNGVLQNL